MHQAFDQYNSSVSFGQCEGCGVVSDLFFREDNFKCGGCSGIDKLKKPKFRLFGRH